MFDEEFTVVNLSNFQEQITIRKTVTNWRCAAWLHTALGELTCVEN
jgi:hypothetical protein